MPCDPILNKEGHRVGFICTTTHYEYVYEGKTWLFEYHEYLGPWRLKRNGDPYKYAPGPKSKFWAALAAWHKEQFGEK